ncbi:Uncharacterized conserved protein, DUF58 family, contains vWF domain [Amphritea atlantica]|uniref:Uncharacterized conserved protein, DUF58 family, contains vWF domain n=1 Tax=Amphritea atlantica TaxID=355243 RepID=A0A1H9DLQ5_9GAMM|nr:DUF58 domain-containing protein [Amphritea atlantica]SEQ14440.1 Uncharacterized conserved protein, DUF58 family, contains vWF domain [Amphritea atlantica]
MTGSIRQRLGRAVIDWSLRRSPRLKQLTLSQRRIYIMPSQAGAVFLMLLLVMLILAINFQNNLMFAVTFLLASLFVVTILHTYANLSGLTIQFVRGHPCFLGEQAAFDLTLTARGTRQYESIQLRLREGEGAAIDLVEDRQRSLTLYQNTHRRGYLPADALLIETFYPLGLFRAWTWLQVDLKSLVYPRPVEGGQLPDMHDAAGGDQQSPHLAERPGGEEFTGLEQYQAGMSLKRVAWKNYARGQGMHAKQYVELSDNRRWLSWELWPELSGEARLSRLTWWALQLHRRGEEYGLRLPGIEIRPDRGESHRVRVLEALACFGLDSPVELQESRP